MFVYFYLSKVFLLPIQRIEWVFQTFFLGLDKFLNTLWVAVSPLFSRISKIMKNRYVLSN